MPPNPDILNSTGPKSWYIYTTDSLVQHGVFLSDDIAAIAGFPLATVPTPEMPRRSAMRHVWVETRAAGVTYRKRIPCPTVDNTLYAGEVSQPVDIGTVTWYTTGRRGEEFSFPRYSEGPPP